MLAILSYNTPGAFDLWLLAIVIPIIVVVGGLIIWAAVTWRAPRNAKDSENQDEPDTN